MADAWCIIAQASRTKRSADVEKWMESAQKTMIPSEIKEAKALAESWMSSHRSGGTMPMHSRSFLVVASPVNPRVESHPENEVSIRSRSNKRVNGCEAGHWVQAVLGDGEIVKLEDGSVWRVDDADTVDSSIWLVADEVIVCDEKLTDINDESTVAAHRFH